MADLRVVARFSRRNFPDGFLQLCQHHFVEYEERLPAENDEAAEKRASELESINISHAAHLREETEQQTVTEEQDCRSFIQATVKQAVVVE